MVVMILERVPPVGASTQLQHNQISPIRRSFAGQIDLGATAPARGMKEYCRICHNH
jgi:hypothetical protein